MTLGEVRKAAETVVRAVTIEMDHVRCILWYSVIISGNGSFFFIHDCRPRFDISLEPSEDQMASVVDRILASQFGFRVAT